jgi:RimJ/RimL family protein N-acetyltransferase
VHIIETERLALRRLSPADDAPFMLDLLNQPSFIQNVGDRCVRTLQEARAYISSGAVASYERYGFGLYLAVLKDNGEAAGLCGLVKREGLDDVDIGFAFLPQFWGAGYCTEAASAVKSYARDVVGLKRLVAITVPGNTPSIRVLEKIGFAFERMIRLSVNGEELKLFSMNFDSGDPGQKRRGRSGSRGSR